MHAAIADVLTVMSTVVKLPPLPRKSSIFSHADPNSYLSSYTRDYQVKGPVPRVCPRPTSTTRKHNPQPRRVFLLRRMFNEPVCNVWTPPEHTKTPSDSSIALASKALMSCAQYSYRFPLGHINFRRKPTRFGANKDKLISSIGIVPVTSVRENDLSGSATPPQNEPLSMEVNGKKRKLTAAYVMDQHLPQYKALEDMKERSVASKERYTSQAVKRPSRRKLVHPQPSSLKLMGSVDGRREKLGNGDSWAKLSQRLDRSLVRRHKGEFYSLHKPWPACYSCWAGPL